MQSKETVFMKSPSGEIREVEATPEVLTPLMVQGWHQHVPSAAPAHTEEEK